MQQRPAPEHRSPGKLTPRLQRSLQQASKLGAPCRSRAAPSGAGPPRGAGRYVCGGSRRHSESERSPPALRRTAAAPRPAEPKRSSIARSTGTPEAPGGEKCSRVPRDLPARASSAPPLPAAAAALAPAAGPPSPTRAPPPPRRSSFSVRLSGRGAANERDRRVTAGIPRAAPPVASRSLALCPALALECAPSPDGRGGGGRGGSSPAHARSLRPPHALKPRLLLVPPSIGSASSVPGEHELPIGSSRCRATEPPGPTPRRAGRLLPPAGVAGRGWRGVSALGWEACGEQQVGPREGVWESLSRCRA